LSKGEHIFMMSDDASFLLHKSFFHSQAHPCRQPYVAPLS
jgi:hypothetical protein